MTETREGTIFLVGPLTLINAAIFRFVVRLHCEINVLSEVTMRFSCIIIILLLHVHSTQHNQNK